MIGPREDDFEFKPLTSGLGFDQKTKGLKPAAPRSVGESPTVREMAPTPALVGKKESSVAAQKVSQIISSLPSLDFLDSAPAPKKNMAPTVSTNSLPIQQNSGPLLGDIPGLPKRDRQGASPVAPKATGSEGSISTIQSASTVAAAKPKNTMPVLETQPLEMKLTEVPFHVGAAIFDMLVVIGLTCLFAVALLLITGTDLNIILLNAQTDLATQLGVGLLVLSVFALYSVIGRAFCGMTLGEWTFDLQVGSDGDQMKAWYPLAITLRWVLLVATGLFLFPVLSSIFGKDLLGRMTGAKLYQLGPASR